MIALALPARFAEHGLGAYVPRGNDPIVAVVTHDDVPLVLVHSDGDWQWVTSMGPDGTDYSASLRDIASGILGPFTNDDWGGDEFVMNQIVSAVRGAAHLAAKEPLS